MSIPKMPVLFIGHGSPMNAIQDNRYTADLRAMALELPLPKAILVVSAHWLTEGTWVTSGARPPQIYDFYGFPEELYQLIYSPAGSPECAARVCTLKGNGPIRPDERRGIDHAGWAVVKHLYPQADIPLLELSLDVRRTPAEHYRLGQSLLPLREEGILVIGSGNIVHNLRLVSFDEDAPIFPWAQEFDARVSQCLASGRHQELIEYASWGPIARQAVPTDEHYLPMLYAAALQQEGESLVFFHESLQNASISMRCFRIG
jgi:4,5-DOPA dioxygenase extradiol